jgi:leader peptidase (prepilin peptidase)/N-methyltransferase
MIHVSAGLAGGLGCGAVSPYLARLTASVPDRSDHVWWRGQAVGRRRLVATAVLATVLGLLAGVQAGWTVAVPVFVGLAALLTPLGVIDVVCHRLPDRLVAAAAVYLVASLAGVAAVDDQWPRYGRALEAGVALLAAMLALALATQGSLGLGDVKLCGVLGAYAGWFGWTEVVLAMVAAFGLATLTVLPLLVLRRATLATHVAFGPMLLLGTFLAPAWP